MAKLYEFLFITFLIALAYGEEIDNDNEPTPGLEGLQIVASGNVGHVQEIVTSAPHSYFYHKGAKFGHHVTIYTDNTTESYCSGSIINDKWILTSMRCVQDGEEFRIDFNKDDLFDDSPNKFSIIVDNSAAELYPTLYPEQDDIALIKLPVKLDFTDLGGSVKPIKLSLTNVFDDNKLGVMVGFKDKSETIDYYMLKRSPFCNDADDEDLQFCAMGWKNGTEIPNVHNIGAGLLINWPKEPLLVGILSYTDETKVGPHGASLSYYTDVTQYLDWIKAIIFRQQQENAQ